jgi:rhodanese-related sulfurtransferase
MKKLLFQIVLIIVVASIFGLIYNYRARNPLPLIYQGPKVNYVSDSAFILQPDSTSQHIIDTTKTLNNLSANKEISEEQTGLNKNIKNLNQQHSSNTLGSIDSAVSYEQVVKHLNDTNFVFVDARTIENYNKGHIGKSINIYPYLEQSEYIKKLLNLPDNKIIIVYCDGGTCELSHIVIEDLQKFGYKKIFIYEGGWEEWEKKTKS